MFSAVFDSHLNPAAWSPANGHPPSSRLPFPRSWRRL